MSSDFFFVSELMFVFFLVLFITCFFYSIKILKNSSNVSISLIYFNHNMINILRLVFTYKLRPMSYSTPLICYNPCDIVSKIISYWCFIFHCTLNPIFEQRIRQFHADIPPKFQYINGIFSPRYDLAYDINRVVITRKPVLSTLRSIQSESF